MAPPLLPTGTLARCCGTQGGVIGFMLLLEKGFGPLGADTAELDRAILMVGADAPECVVFDRFIGRA